MTAAAELDFTNLGPTLPIPDDVESDEGFIKTFDDTDLYWQSWTKDGAKGSIALMHGYGEHSGRYHHVAAALARAGYNVMAIDARGHGRSAGVRGHVFNYDDYARDLSRLVGEVESAWGLPLFVLGHSNGGLISLRHALMKDERVLGYVVSSPFCGFAVKVPAVKAAAGNLMSKFWPTFSMPTEIPPDVVSHLKVVVDKYGSDPLNTSVTTARWYTETKDAQADLLSRAQDINQPFLFLVSGSDELADARAAEEVYHRMSSHDRAFEILPDLFHEVLNEEPWDELMVQIVSWLDERLP